MYSFQINIQTLKSACIFTIIWKDLRWQYLYIMNYFSLVFLFTDNCKPESIWLLVRHGVRYITKDTLKKIEKLEDIRDQIIYNHEVLKSKY